MTARFDVVAIGNALVDVISHESFETVASLGLELGSMSLVDADRVAELYTYLAPSTEASGGSAANTIAGVASFGGTAAFIGRVADDDFGHIYAHDLRAIGVHFDAVAAPQGSTPTGRCLVMVTPDAERTMSTFLGAGTDLDPTYVDESVIGDAQVLYLEGYLWDQPAAMEAFRLAASVAHGAGRKVSLSLSDSFCVDRHRAAFLELIADDVDILFANESEVLALYQTDDFETAIKHVRGHCEIAAITRGADGSVVITADAVIAVPAAAVDQVVDTTGAGDLYAAGFLYGYTHGKSMETCAVLGGIAAAEVISHIGARPHVALETLAIPHLT